MSTNWGQLRAADIIVSTTGAAVSGAIRSGTGSSVSHSMIYIGNAMVVEAIAEGVKRRTLDQALREATLAISLRRRNLTEAQRQAVITHANAYADKNLPYDEVGAFGSGTATRRGRVLATAGCSLSLLACGAGAAAIARNASPQYADDAFFCSELVARVYELAGAPIVDAEPSFTTPRHVRVATTLMYVSHVKDV